MKHKLKKYIKKNNFIILFVIIILLFPIVLGLFYTIDGPSIIPIEPEGLLSFYGTAFGIFSSFVLFILEKRKDKEERNRDIKPILTVECEKVDDVFKLTINNFTQKEIKQIMLYDEYLCNYIKGKKEVYVSYMKSPKEFKYSKANCNDLLNITLDENIIDIDGYPKYITVDSEDIDNKMWTYEFRKIKNGDNIFYNLHSTKLV